MARGAGGDRRSVNGKWCWPTVGIGVDSKTSAAKQNTWGWLGHAARALTNFTLFHFAHTFALIYRNIPVAAA